VTTTIRLLAAVAVLLTAGALASSAALADDVQETYYLSLGDSLAQGYQPTGGPSDSAQAPPGFRQGYADQLFKLEREAFPKLRLVKLGCGGETTTTMIEGAWCEYNAGSQLDEAVELLQDGQVEFVTLDIGANDVLECLFTQEPGCLAAGVAAIQANLPAILAALKEAAGTDVPIVGMTYYNLFAGTPQAPAIDSLNALLEGIYVSSGVAVAQVDDAFAANPAAVCAWTWFCSRYQDVHANTEGYGVIAQTFAEELAG
jgi:lysophospholipase L1-like esterase